METLREGEGQVAEKDESYWRELQSLFRELRSHASSNMELFKQSDVDSSRRRFFDAYCQLREHIDRGIHPGVEYLLAITHLYDLDASTVANGYRSFVLVIERCCQRILAFSRYIACHRESLLFRSDYYSRELEAYVTVLGQLRACLYYLHKLVAYCGTGPNQTVSLFPDDSYAACSEHEDIARQMMSDVENLCQDCFYGRCLGFQFCDSMTRPLTTINLVLASFSEGYKHTSTAMLLAKSVLSGGKYAMDADSRGRQVVNATRNGDIGFCKSFWSLAENSFMHSVPKLACPSIRVNHVFGIQPDAFELKRVDSGHETVTIVPPCAHTGPQPVCVRLVSHELRQGQELLMSLARVVTAPKSRGLIVHCHGGGFVAQSSASHQVYLRHWARDTGVPVLCVDYSLAPELAYPRQLEEVFFAYCWALKNCHLLGTTAEYVCIVGDSAGGTLAVSTALRAISFGVRPPTGILSIYGCMLVKYTPSPSRLLSIMDPLLPLGMLPKCLSAYAGISLEDGGKPEEVFSFHDNEAVSSRKTGDHTSSGSAVLSEYGQDVQQKSQEKDDQPLPSVTGQSQTSNASKIAGFGSDDSGYVETTLSSPAVIEASDSNDCGTVEQTEKPSRTSLQLDLRRSRTQQQRTSSTAISRSSSTPIFTTPVESPSQLAAADNLHHSPFDTPTYAKMRHFAQSPINPFGHVAVNVSRNPYMSPLLASDDLLTNMCPLYFVTCHLDPMLDDSISFARRLRHLGRTAHVDVLDGLPHGFLNFVLVSPEAKAGSELCIRRLKQILSCDASDGSKTRQN